MKIVIAIIIVLFYWGSLNGQSLPDSIETYSMKDFNRIMKRKGTEQVKKLHFFSLSPPKSASKLKKFKNIIELYVYSEDFECLPDIFGEFKQLKRISMGWSKKIKLFELFNVLAKADSLEELVITGSDIGEIPANISKLKNLKRLNLVDNKIIFLPEGIRDLTNLNVLRLNYNPINFDSLAVLIKTLKNIDKLDLGDCGLSKWPSDMKCLESVVELYLGRNKFTCIPDEIIYLKNLEFLYVGANIDTITDKIVQMINLKLLKIIGNPIAHTERIEYLKTQMPHCMILQ